MKKNSLAINATKLVMLMFILMISTFPLVSQVKQKLEKVEITENSTLHDLLAAAALNNPGLKAAFERWQAALARVPQVKALPDPQLNFSYFIREIETRVGPQQAKVGFMQMFPWFGKLKLKGKAAAEAANAQNQQYESIKRSLFYEVKTAYYDYYYAVRTAEVLKENVALLENLESVIQVKYRTGNVSYAILVKIQVEGDKLQDRLKSALDYLEPVKARLNAALNRPVHALLPVPKAMAMENESIELSRERLMERLKANSPVLKAIDAMAAKSEISIRLAKKNYYPDFSFGVDYMLTGEARMPGVADSGKDPLAAMVSIRLPLWIKKNKAGVNEANALYRAALYQREETENNLLARLEMVLFKFRDAERKVKLYRESLLPRAQQALEVTRSAFEAGKANFLDFIDSQRMLLMFELEYEEARTLRAQRLAELQMLAEYPTSNEGGSFRENRPPNPPAKAFDKVLIKSFLGVQGAIFQKSPLTVGDIKAKGE
jgi:cobalt-zinc-cadmium efflux system outer membrane protein